MKWFGVLALCLVVGASAAPHGSILISNTTQCEAVGGSCSVYADCDLSNNAFVGSCDNTSFGCCVSKYDVCTEMNGECLSAAECDAKSGYRATRLACSNGVCCVPRRSSPRNGGNGKGPGSSNGEKYRGHKGSGHRGRRPAAPQGPGMISNTTQCEAVGGSCSASADCDLSSNVFVGSCDNTSFGCCVSKDELCGEKNESSAGQVPCGSLPGQENDSQDLSEDRDDLPYQDDNDSQDESENLDERPDQDDYDNQRERQNLGNSGRRGGHGRGHGGRY